MNLVDRYLAAIGRELPKRSAAEITAELRDVLLSKIEDREAEIGRDLTDKEIEGLLIDFGHPLEVAGRYRKMQYLIGPEIFPFWLASMRLALMIGGAVLLGTLLMAAANTQSTWVSALQRAGHAFWPGFVWIFAVVTLVFAVMERMGGAPWKHRWSPRQLPSARSRGRKPFDMMAEIAAGVVALLWWTGLIRFRAWMPLPPQFDVHLASTWAPFYYPIITYLVAEIAINLLALVRPGLGAINAGLSLARHLAGAALTILVLKTGHWVDVSAGAPPEAMERMTRGFDYGVHLALTVTAAVFVIKAAMDGWRLAREAGGGRAGNGGGAATYYVA